MNEKTENKKDITLESLVSDMVQKAVSSVRSEYEKTINEMEERTKKTISELEDKLYKILAQMQPYKCYNCDKDLISGKDAIYTSYDGHKFCSHKCIDDSKEKRESEAR